MRISPAKQWSSAATSIKALSAYQFVHSSINIKFRLGLFRSGQSPLALCSIDFYSAAASIDSDPNLSSMNIHNQNLNLSPNDNFLHLAHEFSIVVENNVS